MSRTAFGPAAGFVLAGGASRRMGTDKALLAADGTPLVKRAVEVVNRAVGSCTVVAPAGRYESLGIPVLADDFPGEGPLGGILTALGKNASPWNLIVAVDMPFLDETFLRELLAESRSDGEVIAPANANGSLEPLCALYPVAALPSLRAFYDAGGRSVRQALQTLPVRTIPAPERAVTNINTPEQWEAVR